LNTYYNVFKKTKRNFKSKNKTLFRKSLLHLKLKAKQIKVGNALAYSEICKNLQLINLKFRCVKVYNSLT